MTHIKYVLLYLQFSIIFYAISISDTCLRSLKSISIPNFEYLNPENGRPPFWNSTSGFIIDLCVVISMTFCIYLPNFVVIGRTVAEF